MNRKVFDRGSKLFIFAGCIAVTVIVLASSEPSGKENGWNKLKDEEVQARSSGTYDPVSRCVTVSYVPLGIFRDAELASELRNAFQAWPEANVIVVKVNGHHTDKYGNKSIRNAITAQFLRSELEKVKWDTIDPGKVLQLAESVERNGSFE